MITLDLFFLQRPHTFCGWKKLSHYFYLLSSPLSQIRQLFFLSYSKSSFCLPRECFARNTEFPSCANNYWSSWNEVLISPHMKNFLLVIYLDLLNCFFVTIRGICYYYFKVLGKFSYFCSSPSICVETIQEVS
jgi:hypothetical protein